MIPKPQTTKQAASILFAFLLSLSGYAQQVAFPPGGGNIPGLDISGPFGAYLLANDDVNTNNDGMISIPEARAFRGSFDLENLQIDDFSGIEWFVNLESLDCSGNNLTELDLGKNIALQFLDCSGNRLTELDLGKNADLRSLDCSGNQLERIYLSRLGDTNAWESFNCSNNQLDHLFFPYFHARIQNLQVDGNSGLECIETALDPADAMVIYDQKKDGPEGDRWLKDEGTSFCNSAPSLWITSESFSSSADLSTNRPSIPLTLELSETTEEPLTLDNLIDMLVIDPADAATFSNFEKKNDYVYAVKLKITSTESTPISISIPAGRLTDMSVGDRKGNTEKTLLSFQYERSPLTVRIETYEVNARTRAKEIRFRVTFSHEVKSDLSLTGFNSRGRNIFGRSSLECKGCEISGEDYGIEQENANPLEYIVTVVPNPDGDGEIVLSLPENSVKTKVGGHYNLGAESPTVRYLGATPFVDIPDEKFKKRLLAIASLDQNNDGEISVPEATGFLGEIDVSYARIGSISGIEAFIHITGLSCNNNNLGSLDLSKNVELETINCNNNNLVILDLSKNVELGTINCNNNNLGSLDLRENVKLVSINCNNNNLGSLDLRENVKLVSIDCIHNELTSLNLNNGNNQIITGMKAIYNPKLVCIRVDEGFTVPKKQGWRKPRDASYCTYPTVLEIVSTNPLVVDKGHTNLGEIPFEITFSEGVTGFTAEGLLIGYIPIGGDQPGTVSINGLREKPSSGDGEEAGTVFTFTLDVPDPAAAARAFITIALKDGALGNPSGSDDILFSFSHDRKRPTLTISSGTSSPTSLTSIPIEIRLSEAVKESPDQIQAALTVSARGSIGELAPSGEKTYTTTLTVSGEGDADITIGMPAAVLTDPAGNGNNADPSLFSIRYEAPSVESPVPPQVAETEAPTVLAIVGEGVDDLGFTNLGEIPFEITFSEAVTGFAAEGLEIGYGAVSAEAGKGVQEKAGAPPGTVFTFTVVVENGELGDLTIGLKAGAVTDAAGNPNERATGVFSIVHDRKPPTVAISSPGLAEGGVTNLNEIPFTFTFSEPVRSFLATDLTLGRCTLVDGSIDYSKEVPDGLVYTASVMPTGSAGAINRVTVTVNLVANRVADRAGNRNIDEAGVFSIVYDGKRPSVKIASKEKSPTGLNEIPITVTFSEPPIGFDAGDITVTGGALKANSLKPKAGNALDNVLIYGATVSPSADGMVTISIAQNEATDAAGNGNTGSNLFRIEYRPRVEVLGIPGTEKATVILYPNPSLEVIHLDLDPVRDMRIKLSSLDGRIVKDYGAQRGGTVRLGVDGLLPGTYLLQIASGDKTLVRRIIVN